VTIAAAAPLAGSQVAPGGEPYRLMVVDDSAIVRGLLIRSLEADPEVTVVASASNGEIALAALGRHDVEVVILDIEMPVMDGLTALPKMLQAKPGLKVLIASSLTRRGAEISLRALAAGAADYLTKPGTSALTSADEFKQELLIKVKALAQAGRSALGITKPRRRPIPSPRVVEPRPEPTKPRVVERPAPAPAAKRVIALRPMIQGPAPEVIAIGSSTGGPQALFRILATFKGHVKQPVFITQHMPATFTTILAEHVGNASGYPSSEAVDGEPVRAGHIYIAPGDFHMTIAAGQGQNLVRLNKNPPENFCRPSVDPMLRSLSVLYGERVFCAILTGMGHDGLAGSEAVVAAGGTVIAQDQSTSVVWGMPGAVATAGLCSAVLPLDEIGPFIGKAAGRGS
jgi:two-component system, chemotaxis family, protein-glutamate methylesterase/glutaminase